VLERYKNVDGIAAAWRLAAPRLPGATLRVVGRGREARTVEELVADLPGRVVWTPALPTADVVRALDESSVLLLPSRSEGLPRVALEALLRGRPVIGGRAGGIPDAVRHEVNGLLVDPEDPQEIADALARVLTDRELLERLAAACRPSVAPWLQTAEEYARSVRAVVAQASRSELTARGR
jgi:glycosyltransferase involved in cell wall biosynthesis